jgi:hypothetical protein
VDLQQLPRTLVPHATPVPLLALERWLLRQPPQRAQALLLRPLMRKLIDNCRLVAVKAADPPATAR